MPQTILVVDDDPSFNNMLSAFLKRNNFHVNSVFSSASALASLSQQTPDLVLTDFKLPDMDGLELMREIKDRAPNASMILMTNYSDVRTAVKSIQLGAFEFVTKPVNPDELLLTVNAALKQSTKRDVGQPSEAKSSGKQKAVSDRKYIVGRGAKARQTWEHIQLVAPTKMGVLILGESGTGKEYAAKMIHESSKRSNEAFAAVDCGALSKELAASELFGHVKGAFTGALADKKGQFELANGGTLFLDEVGNLPYEVQVQLLRALQEKKIRKVGSEKDIDVNVRIIAATNERMAEAIDEQQFRLDLYHRLNEFELKLIPLRERIGDLDEYLTHFLEEANAELEKVIKGVSPEVNAVFQQYSWPGNLRELRNVVRRAALLCQEEEIGLAHIPSTLVEESRSEEPEASDGTNGYDLKNMQEHREKETIERVLMEVRYNKTKAAELLNIDRTTLYNKLAKYNIKA
ncbi:sigma-54-dependent transcriptional regulator [Roseivirga pacifica]|uniref:sigma-54-dependent transcriptional regulator n=1 Tax=Roseivirga pacifica TaxID=1267423 RepID=UPI002095AA0A|nr:sigma-54 dependent transcriptional regulator [Roseivirga pacifica]MCO6360956.1 response regulator [Roseivirga pacifica]MCO6368845.1 response regulator [Roseivirga pacifica]MCO6372989.1 response regulator [Roseivirga pacifica]MCO6377049.1 response regulator [Roseivirga pacifica]MCO6377674.1 response regulator [Roseivirga pacifica]